MFGTSGGRLAIVLEPPGGGGGASWGHLGAILSCLGASLERLDPDFPAKWSLIDAFHLGCKSLHDFLLIFIIATKQSVDRDSWSVLRKWYVYIPLGLGGEMLVSVVKQSGDG